MFRPVADLTGTGRADYFGSVANMAARIMVTARPGQVFVQGTTALVSLGHALPPDVLQVVSPPAPSVDAGADASASPVHLHGRKGSRMSDASLHRGGSVEVDGHSTITAAVARFRTMSKDEPGASIGCGQICSRHVLLTINPGTSARGITRQHSASGHIPGTARYIGEEPTADSTLLLLPLGRFKLKVGMHEATGAS